MPGAWTPTQRWIAEQVHRLADRRLTAPPAIVRDTTNFMSIDRDDVVDLGGELFLVTCTEQERRFGLEGEPKFWVKRARALPDGRLYILKMVFHEIFHVQIEDRKILCARSAEKEARVLDLTRGDYRFMQGRAVRDARGNLVRVIEFIHGTDLLSRLSSVSMPHDEYCRAWLPQYLDRTIACFDGIRLLHEAGLCHGDIRNDHIIIERDTGHFRWIDFDLKQDGPEFDVWALGNVLHCVLGCGLVTFREVFRTRPDLADRLTADDASVFFPNRIMNLRPVFPHLPARLGEVLARFSAGARTRYDAARQIVDDLRECLDDLGDAGAVPAGGVGSPAEGGPGRS